MALKYPPLWSAPAAAVRERRSGAPRPQPDAPLSTPPKAKATPKAVAQPKTHPHPAPQPGASQPDPPPLPKGWPTDAPTDWDTPDPPTPRSRRPRLFLSVLLGALALAGVLAASWLLLPIRKVTVTGNHQLSSLEVRRLAGLDGSRPFGWLYYGPWRAGALRDNAWVQAAQITRRFPDEVQLTINERQPAAWFRNDAGELSALAADATPLPLNGRPDSVQPPLPVISGWGPNRSDDALYAVGALSRYNVKSVEYTPTGLTIQTSKGTIWSGDRELLLKYAGAIENQGEGSRINLYPWGVSVQK